MKKFLWMTALIGALAVLFISCDDGSSSGTSDITWTLEQKGGIADESSTTHIVVKFSKAVDTILSSSVTVTGAAARYGSLAKGTGNDWEIPVTVSASGNATVKINNLKGVANGEKTIAVIFVPKPGIGGNLGPITIANGTDGKQKGWATNGTDDIETDLDVVTLINAQSLKLVLGQALGGGLQIVWQGDGTAPGVNAWNWNSNDIASSTGVPDAAKGATWDDATKTLTIDLPTALAGYAALENSYKAKLFICYYTPDVDALGIVSADLIAKTTPIVFRFVTFDADGGEWDIGTPTKPEVVSEQVVRVKNGETLGANFPESPIKSGFHVEKWVNPSNAEVTADTTISADVTFKAVWATGDPIDRTVTFDTNGGTPATIASITVLNGSGMGAKYPTSPTKTDSIFAGWFDSSDIVYTSTTAITADVDLKAKWTAIVYPSEPTTTPSATGFIFVRDLAVDGGNTLADWAMGKGNIKGDDLTKIRAAEDGSIILLSITSPNATGHSGWGTASIGGVSINIPGGAVDDQTYFVQIKVSDILTAIGDDATEIYVNIWGVDNAASGVVQKAQLWEPDPGYVPPTSVEKGPFTLTIAANGEWGYQGTRDDIFDATVTTGDEYEITFTFTSDVATTSMQFVIVDNSVGNDNYGWTAISGYIPLGENVSADTPITKTIVITATGTSKSVGGVGDKFVVTTGTDPTGALTLNFSSFLITKK